MSSYVNIKKRGVVVAEPRKGMLEYDIDSFKRHWASTENNGVFLVELYYLLNLLPPFIIITWYKKGIQRI